MSMTRTPGCCKRMTLTPWTTSRRKMPLQMTSSQHSPTPLRQSFKRSNLAFKKTTPVTQFFTGDGGTPLAQKLGSRTPFTHGAKHPTLQLKSSFSTKTPKLRTLITSRSAHLISHIVATSLHGQAIPMAARCTPCVFVTSQQARN